MEHDGCIGCRYETYPEKSEQCEGCVQNAVDKYIPATIWDQIRGMDDYELMEFLVKVRDNQEKSLEEVLNDTHY